MVKNNNEPLAHFTYHKQPITSIEWARHDESVLCLSCEDNQVTIWDLSVEADAENGGNKSHALSSVQMDKHLNDLPPQLLFIHQGQTDVKEVHYHPQIPGVIMSSAESSMDLLKPAINVVS